MADRSCTPVVNRRSLFAAYVAVPLFAAVPALAGSRLQGEGIAPDAELLALASRLIAARAQASAASDAAEAAQEAYIEALPPIPSELRITSEDRHHWPWLRAEDGEHIDRALVARFEHQAENEERCGGRPDSDPYARYRHRRGQQIIAASAAWRAASLTGTCGAANTLAERADDLAQAAYETQWTLERAIRETPAYTVAGLHAKASVWFDDEAGEEETRSVLRSLRADLQRMEG